MGPWGSVGGCWDTGAGQWVVNRDLGVSWWLMDTGGQWVIGGALGVSRWLVGHRGSVGG